MNWKSAILEIIQTGIRSAGTQKVYEDTCCHLVSSEKPLANTGGDKAVKSTIIMIIKIIIILVLWWQRRNHQSHNKQMQQTGTEGVQG